VACADLGTVLLPRDAMAVDRTVQTTLAAPPLWIWALLGILLALAPGSSKVAGSIWFLMVGAAAWALFFVPKAKALLEEEAELLSLSRLWLYFCVAAFLFKAVGMVYWSDPWWTRHFDFRILCAAVSMPILLARYRTSQAQSAYLVAALFIASGVALVVAYMHAYHDVETPAQRINWAGGLVMLACITLPLITLPSMSTSKRWAMTMATLALVMAVLLTGSRGPYLALPWLVLGGLFMLARNLKSLVNLNAAGLRLAGLLVAIVVALPLAVPKVFEVPAERVMLGLTEVRALVTGVHMDSKAIDTSVGTRVYMWQRSKQKIIESPWIGYGREQRMAFIQAWGTEVDAEMVTDQTHLHSEYINGLIDHGIFGLLSTLSLMAGATVLAWRLRRRFPVAAFSVGGIAFTHFVMSFTDTNSQTNNYSVMITVSLLIIFLLAWPKPQPSSSPLGRPLIDAKK
jgi:O-antigen ligase